MIERAAWGRTANGWHDGWRRVRLWDISWLRGLAAALLQTGDCDPVLRAPNVASTVEARAEVAPQPDDPRVEVIALYKLPARAVLGSLCAHLPTLDDAEDALAEVFIAALAQCAAGQSPSIGWLLTVARRRTADFYRRRHAAWTFTIVDSATLMTPGDGPEEAALRAEAVREALMRVAALPDDQRDALALRFTAGLRAPQIAAVLGKSHEATRALLSRALRRLQKELAR